MKNSYLIVLDNIQVYARRRDIRIGTHNEMLVGTGATAVQMEDCPDGALALQPVLEALRSGKRRAVTVDGILKSLDLDHATIVGTLLWLDALVSFVLALARYRSGLSEWFATKARKHQINPHRRTVIHPLGTNNENEMTA